MRIGILGSGLMGGKLGTIFARAGHEVVFSYARSEQKLKTLAAEAKGKATHGTPREAALEADAILLAVHWSRTQRRAESGGRSVRQGRLTCSLPMNEQNTALVIAHTTSGAEELQRKIPKAHVVSAFNTVPSEVLFGVYEARRRAGRPSLVYCADHAAGKASAGEAHPRRGLRARGYRPVAHRPLHRSLRTAHRRARVRRRRRAGAGVSVRTLCATRLRSLTIRPGSTAARQ